MTVLYTEAEADLGALEDRTLAVIGYDDLGRSIALNLRDSGLTPLIGEVNEVRAGQARADGFEPLYPADAASAADMKLLTIPDELLPEVYMAHISPGLKSGDMLVFTGGYCLTFGFIEPPPFVDAVMLAPRILGADLREQYLNGRGALSFVSVAQDSSGRAWDRLLALAKATGALRGGAVELTFQQQAELDLFVQQALLPALHQLMLTAADLLVREGYPPEAALLSLYISGELGDMINKAAQRGMMNTLRLYSLTGQYGMLSREERFQDARLRRQMEAILEEIRSGKFAKEWTAEYLNGYPRLDALRTRRSALSLWELERRAIDLIRQAARDGNR